DDRADDGSLLTSEVTRKREWETSLVPGTDAERERLRRLVEGHGLAVDFADGSAFSWSGIGPKTSNGTPSSSGGPRTGSYGLPGGGVLAYALARKMRQADRAWSPADGWTLAVFKRLSAADGGDDVTLVDHVATGNVAVVRGAAANPVGVTQYRSGVAGSWSMGRWIDVATNGDVSICGWSNANTPTAYTYAELVVWPFAIPSTWAQQLSTFRTGRAVGQLPRVSLGGDCVDGAAVAVRCRMQRAELEQQMVDGAWAPNARRDDYSIRSV
ncbi:MAG TPA: hypothetical protein VGF99_00655, partial [Myxococcota bacterium]